MVGSAVCQHRFEQCNAKVIILEDEIRALRRERERFTSCEATLESERARLAHMQHQLEDFHRSTVEFLGKGKTMFDAVMTPRSRVDDAVNDRATSTSKSLGLSSIRDI